MCTSVSEGKIRSVVGHHPSSHRLCGVYAFRKEYLNYFNDVPGFMRNVGCGGMPPNEADVAQVIELMLRDGLEIRAVEASGYYVDIDKPWHIWEACHRVIDDMAENLKSNLVAETATISKDARISGYIVLGENSHVGPGVIVRGNLWVGRNTTVTDGAIIGSNCVIGDNCTVEEYCKLFNHTVIGNECRIRHAAEVDGIFMDSVYATHYSEFRGIIGESVDLGAATVCGTLRFDDGFTLQKIKGRKEVPFYDANATFIGDFVRTGVNVITLPGVKIGPYSAIGPGVIVTEDVPSHSLILAKQELVRREWGPHRYGW
jgi:bifunctional UDP-N-acetylglucosamine pyrophosphorylase/glucosamine-1-phosphate N-acetyltransferase